MFVTNPLLLSLLSQANAYQTYIDYTGMGFIMSLFAVIIISYMYNLHLKISLLKNQVIIFKEKEYQKQTKELNNTKDKLQVATTAKRDFIASVSHEIRTPLNGIIGMNKELSETALDSTQKECVSTIANSAEHLLEILNSILDYSKLEAGKRSIVSEAFCANEIINQTTNVFTHFVSDKLHFSRNFNNIEGLWLQGDATALRQILFNLLNNAFKFTLSGEIQFHSQYEKGTLCITVSDTGVGIPSHKQPQIFDPFVQADTSKTKQFGGTGLGLAVTKSLVEAMGGTIALKSEEGEGTTFNVSLPIPQTASHCHERESINLPTFNNKKRVLIVEDNRINQRVASRFLSTIDVHTTVATNGLEALEFCQEQSFDLILMDIMMPIMSGEEATPLIRKLPTYSEVPIIALTAEAVGVDKKYYSQFGMNDYISKPLKKENFLEVVINYL